jgi:signal transduction histidine kinase
LRKFPRFSLASWSTFGQTALLIFAALLVAQLFAFFLLRNFIEQWQSSAVVDPAVSRFAEVAQQVAAAPEDKRAQILTAVSREEERFILAASIGSLPLSRQTEIESNLKAALKKRAVAFSAVVAFRRGGFHGRPPLNMPPAGPGNDAARQPPWPGPVPMEAPSRMWRREPGGPPPGHMREEIRLAAMLADGNWLVGRFQAERPLPLFASPIFVSEAALFVILLAVSLLWASRISRPLRILARAAENLRPQEQLDPIAVKGPRDVQAAIASFNTMAQRVRDLLQEKDRMLSAIGHDLRTPLASLRIRAESIEPEAERERFVESIDEMTRMVEEILSLARLGHSTEPRQLVDLTALADSLVEEFRGLGKAASFEEAPRIALRMQVGPVRRLLRNLLDNAVKYGEQARVSVLETGEAIELCVEDDGPGIPPEQLAEVLQPFTRLEQSRSRQTGGIGLGLSIADAIARSQGAELILQNRSAGGLRAIVRWPRPADGEKPQQQTPSP